MLPPGGTPTSVQRDRWLRAAPDLLGHYDGLQKRHDLLKDSVRKMINHTKIDHPTPMWVRIVLRLVQ